MHDEPNCGMNERLAGGYHAVARNANIEYCAAALSVLFDSKIRWRSEG